MAHAGARNGLEAPSSCNGRSPPLGGDGVAGGSKQLSAMLDKLEGELTAHCENVSVLSAAVKYITLSIERAERGGSLRPAAAAGGAARPRIVRQTSAPAKAPPRAPSSGSSSLTAGIPAWKRLSKASTPATTTEVKKKTEPAPARNPRQAPTPTSTSSAHSTSNGGSLPRSSSKARLEENKRGGKMATLRPEQLSRIEPASVEKPPVDESSLKGPKEKLNESKPAQGGSSSPVYITGKRKKNANDASADSKEEASTSAANADQTQSTSQLEQRRQQHLALKERMKQLLGGSDADAGAAAGAEGTDGEETGSPKHRQAIAMAAQKEEDDVEGTEDMTDEAVLKKLEQLKQHSARGSGTARRNAGAAASSPSTATYVTSDQLQKMNEARSSEHRLQNLDVATKEELAGALTEELMPQGSEEGEEGEQHYAEVQERKDSGSLRDLLMVRQRSVMEEQAREDAESEASRKAQEEEAAAAAAAQNERERAEDGAANAEERAVLEFCYVDDYGGEQGPFPGPTMVEWFRMGYFDEQTLVRLSTDDPSKLRPVGANAEAFFMGIAEPLPVPNEEGAPARDTLDSALPDISEVEFRYIDDNGDPQGPFSAEQMRIWTAAGYFGPETLVAMSGEVNMQRMDEHPVARVHVMGL